MKKALLWGAALFAIFALTGCQKEPDPPEPFTLTVTGIPQELSIMGASLLLPTDIDNSYATGVNSNGTITFYHPGVDGRLPDYTKPFYISGEYLVALAEVTCILSRKQRFISIKATRPKSPFLQAIPSLGVILY